MKRILFNDKFGLTKAVLEGRKTMTRRIVPEKQLYYIRRHFRGLAVMEAPFKYDEVVAVAQSYKQMCDELDADLSVAEMYIGAAGWGNKMFVKAEDMLHKIRITNIRVERLQDISDEDCLREGIRKMTFDTFSFDSWKFFARSPREAFAALIDKVSGVGTWDSNPWVFVYEFELVK